MAGHRHRKSNFPWLRAFAIVVAIHVLLGSGVFWLGNTQSGQNFARVYNIKIFEPEKPEAQAKQDPPPPPLPPPTPVVAPPVESLKSAAPEVAKAPSSAPPAATLGGSGASWGGKFAGAGDFDGPEGAFHAAVTGKFRKHYTESPEAFGPAELQLAVTPEGTVSTYRLVKSSGSAANDQAILNAAARVQAEGIGLVPPEHQGRVVTVRFVPSS